MISKNSRIDNFKEDKDDVEEDDYMSDDLLKKINDTRPGLTSTSQARKYDLEKKQQEINKLNKEKFKSIKAMEEDRRTEALSKSITVVDNKNKGFNLMKKMGYEIGMSLGKEGKIGIQEPIDVKLKSDREGLGAENEKKRKLEEYKNEMYKKRKQNQMSEEYNRSVFMDAKKKEFRFKHLRGSLFKCQKICYQLDKKSNLEKPHKDFIWFWPSFAIETQKEEKDDDGLKLEKNDKKVELNESIVDDIEPTVDLDLENDDCQELTIRIERICEYLRERYFYCVWCSIKFNDSDDLCKNCPGLREDDHEDS